MNENTIQVADQAAQADPLDIPAELKRENAPAPVAGEAEVSKEEVKEI